MNTEFHYHNLIANGGKLLVVGGNWNKGWDSYKEHPQVLFWTGSQSDIARAIHNHSETIPSNVKAVIMSRFISHSEAVIIMREVRKRRLLLLPQKNDGEITTLLEDFTTIPEVSQVVAENDVEVEEHKIGWHPINLNSESPVLLDSERFVNNENQETDMSKLHKPIPGELKTIIVKYHKSQGTHAEEARRLEEIVRQHGINSSFESIAQSVRKYRDDIGYVVPKEEVDKAKGKNKPSKSEVKTTTETKIETSVNPVAMIDDTEVLKRMVKDAIVSMNLILEHVNKLRTQNKEFMTLKAKMKALIGE